MQKQHFIFVTNDVSLLEDKKVTAVDIKDILLSYGFWAFTERAPLQTRLCVGDEILIYLAGLGRREFVAIATIASTVEPLLPESKESHILLNLGMKFLRNKIGLKDIYPLAHTVKIAPLVKELQFIVNKKYYGLHLRHPIVRIFEDDYRLILSNVN